MMQTGCMAAEISLAEVCGWQRWERGRRRRQGRRERTEQERDEKGKERGTREREREGNSQSECWMPATALGAESCASKLDARYMQYAIYDIQYAIYDTRYMHTHPRRVQKKKRSRIARRQDAGARFSCLN
eukprot:2179312-Rhodomonas_salina.3